MTVNKAYKFILYPSEYKDKVYENIKVDLSKREYHCTDVTQLYKET